MTELLNVVSGTEPKEDPRKLVGTIVDGLEVAYVDAYGQLVSSYEIMRSNAGYYVGNYYFDNDMGGWFPNERVSAGYFKKSEDAEKELKFWEYARKTEDM